LALLVGSDSALAYEQCQLPEAPVIADNLGSSAAELLKAQKVVKDFVAKVDGYLACTEREQSKAQALALRFKPAVFPGRTGHLESTL